MQKVRSQPSLAPHSSAARQGTAGDRPEAGILLR